MSPEQRPTIGIDATAAVTQGAGIGRYTRELVRALVKENEGYRLRLFSARPPQQLPVPDPLPASPDVHYRQAPLSARWLYRIWYRLRLPLPVQAFTGRVDLFHSPDFVLPPVFGHVPTLLTVHDLSFVYYPETFTPALVNYLNRVVPWSVKRATHVLADSQATKEDLIGLWDVPPHKVTVLYSGVDRRFNPVSDPAQIRRTKEKYGLGPDPYILAVSTVQPRKNYQTLARALKPLANDGAPDLVIAGGKGWLYEEVMAEINEQALGTKVHFIGFVEDDDLPALYSGALLFAFPSLYEGFGLPLLEAMACGVPVLTSDASSLPEVAGEAAMQLPPQDVEAWTAALRRLLHDEELRRRLIDAGFRQARRFTWSQSARRLQSVYRQLLQS